MEAAAAAKGEMLSARLGDAGLFDAVLDSLKIAEPWRRRLRRGVARGLSLEAIFIRPNQSALAQPGVLAALESADHAGAKALVEDLLAIAGIDSVGGRTPSVSPTAFSNRRRCDLARRSRPRSARRWRRFWPYPAIPMRRPSSCGAWPIPPA